MLGLGRVWPKIVLRIGPALGLQTAGERRSALAVEIMYAASSVSQNRANAGRFAYAFFASRLSSSLVLSFQSMEAGWLASSARAWPSKPRLFLSNRGPAPS